jgi:hypothetical protein
VPKKKAASSNNYPNFDFVLNRLIMIPLTNDDSLNKETPFFSFTLTYITAIKRLLQEPFCRLLKAL